MGMSKNEYTAYDLYNGERSNYVNKLSEAKKYLKEEKCEEAIILLKEAINAFNTDIALSILKDLNKGNGEQHIIFYMEVYQLKNVYYCLGMAYAHLEKYEKCLEYFFKADEFVQALNIYNGYLEKYDKASKLIRYNLAVTFCKLERYEEASMIFNWLKEQGFLEETEIEEIKNSFMEVGMNIFN